MSSNLVEQLASGSRLLMNFGSRLEQTPDPAQSYRGEITFKIKERGNDRMTLDLTRLSLVSHGVSTSSGPTGKLSVSGIAGEARCTLETNGQWSLAAEFTAEVLYKAIEDKLGFSEPEPGLLEPAVEQFTGSLRGRLAEQEGGDGSGLTMLFSDLELTYRQGGLSWVRQLRLPASVLPPSLSLSPTPSPVCPVDRRRIKRSLRLRPFAFRNGASHTGTSWPDQLAQARTIWGNCCLVINAEDLVILDNPRLRDSENPRQIVQANGHGVDLDGIEVFLVDRILPEGGGATLSGGTALAKVVMTNRNAGNPYMLAHELGHVLAGLHPGRQPVGNKWVADPGTVLEPSNSPNSPNPPRNSLSNWLRARNPALAATGSPCCVNPNV